MFYWKNWLDHITKIISQYNKPDRVNIQVFTQDWLGDVEIDCVLGILDHIKLGDSEFMNKINEEESMTSGTNFDYFINNKLYNHKREKIMKVISGDMYGVEIKKNTKEIFNLLICINIIERKKKF